jgi:hypothetical protein
MAITEKYASSAGAGSNNGTSEANAWSFATMLTSATAGDRINFKGNHTFTGNHSFTNAGTATSPIILRGYSSTIGDCSALGRTNGNGALVTTGMPVFSQDLYQLTMPAMSVLEAVVCSSSTRNGPLVSVGNFSALFRCRFANSGTGGSAAAVDLGGTNAFAVDCDAVMSGASGGSYCLRCSSGNWVVGCRIDGGVVPAATLSSVGTFVNCVIIGGTDCVIINNTGNPAALINCTLVGGSSDGLHIVTGNIRNPLVINCLITDNGAYGLYGVDAGTALFAVGNRIDRNTTAASSGATDWLSAFAGFNNTTSATQSNEFPGYGSDDFRLGSSSPARGIGIPSYLDVGALQRIEDYPAVGNVQDDDTVDGATGTLTLPAIADVESGVQYGAGGTEFTGTLTASSGAGAWTHRMIGGGF